MPLSARSSRVVAGLMSGTSLDGIDAVITYLVGTGRSLTVDVLAFEHVPYPDDLRAAIERASDAEHSSVRDVALLSAHLPLAYAEAVKQALDAASLDRDDLDLVGAHGQTVHHIPTPTEFAGRKVRATLQVGDPSMLAQHLGVPVVGNFRAADVALGGQGAPLAPYLDGVLFASGDETRLLLNLGGIANLTVLPAGGALGDILAFDTGPGNMVVDALARRFYDEAFDPDGTHAGQGNPDHDLLADLLAHDYFQADPPKTTGRELFGRTFADELAFEARSRSLSEADTMATTTLLTAASVYQAYARHVRPEHPADAVIASGGGVHNRTLMRMIEEAFAPIPVHRTSDLAEDGRTGVDPDAKEAVLFAVLAHETANGVATGLPSVTGARRAAVQGSISLPAPETTRSTDRT